MGILFPTTGTSKTGTLYEKGMLIRFGTYKIRNGRSGGLESSLQDLSGKHECACLTRLKIGRASCSTKEVECMVLVGDIDKENDYEWGAPLLSQPKAKTNQLRFLIALINLNRRGPVSSIHRNPYDELLSMAQGWYISLNVRVTGTGKLYWGQEFWREKLGVGSRQDIVQDQDRRWASWGREGADRKYHPLVRDVYAYGNSGPNYGDELDSNVVRKRYADPFRTVQNPERAKWRPGVLYS